MSDHQPGPSAHRPLSSGSLSQSDTHHDNRPAPAKRARKPINCEPCRTSKLKCDRARPACSSCVLRGTVSLCYQDGSGTDSAENTRAAARPKVDPAKEFAGIRKHLANLEQLVLRPTVSLHGEHDSLPFSLPQPSDLAPPLEPVKRESPEFSNLPRSKAPGILHRQPGGLYAGSTSVATHLAFNDSRESASSESRSEDSEPESVQGDYDRDLIALLPPAPVIDKLVAYYFNYCNWIYRHVNQPAFVAAWASFKNGYSGDRVTLATVSVILAIATYYLPQGHEYSQYATSTDEDHGSEYYDVMRQALDRHRAASHSGIKYTIELVELLLVRCHYLYLAKSRAEEVWQLRGELVSIGTAMGLHREPDRRLTLEVAERRRWAWWHIILVERWQAFMFGRPVAIASHHFDTALPSYCDPAHDPTGRIYLPNLALINLAHILGHIMDDAVSLRPVSHEKVMANDKLLLAWRDALPHELNLDGFHVARSLASLDTNTRRLGVQSVIIRVAYHHIRFTLHRQYASRAAALSHEEGGREDEAREASQSLEIAMQSANELVTMIIQARPDFLANSELAVPGHLNWAPFHLFSAGMFFSFQLVANPELPGADMLRNNINRIIDTLVQSRTMSVADKSLKILHALAPLYSDEFRTLSTHDRLRKKHQVLSVVKTLAFPYHDSGRRRQGSSPSAMDSPSTSSSTVSPGGPSNMALPVQHPPQQAPPPPPEHASHKRHLEQLEMPSLQRPDAGPRRASKQPRRHTPPGHGSPGRAPAYAHHYSPPALSPATPTSAAPFAYPPPAYDPHAMQTQHEYAAGAYEQGAPAHAAPAYGESLRYPVDAHAQHHEQGDPAMYGLGMGWGANMGFGEGEWTQFLSSMGHEQSGNGGYPMHPPS